MTIYFVTARELGRVKIGFTENVQTRLAKMRSDSPTQLLLERVCEGSLSIEAELHARFAEFRVVGEWFDLVHEIEEFMKELPRPACSKCGRGMLDRRPDLTPRGGMSLDEFLRRDATSAKALAAALGISEASLSRIRRGEQNITRETIRAIVEAIGGAVTAEELVFAEAAPPAGGD